MLCPDWPRELRLTFVSIREGGPWGVNIVCGGAGGHLGRPRGATSETEPCQIGVKNRRTFSSTNGTVDGRACPSQANLDSRIAGSLLGDYALTSYGLGAFALGSGGAIPGPGAPLGTTVRYRTATPTIRLPSLDSSGGKLGHSRGGLLETSFFFCFSLRAPCSCQGARSLRAPCSCQGTLSLRAPCSCQGISLDKFFQCR